MSWRAPRSRPSSLPTTTISDAFTQEEEAPLSVSDRRTFYLVNIFIADTARFLNRFSAICEEKLSDVHRRILRLDATLMLLEAKLKSVDGVSELEEHPGFDIVRSLDQAMPRNSLNSVNSPVISGSSDPSSSSVNIQHDATLAVVKSEGSSFQHSMESMPHQHINGVNLLCLKFLLVYPSDF
eukprot:TRINITY_DN6051_c0_g1_i5.p1 TRINITY_DN6051_c0_g1~~TRINITY_DN6051_c0_g1_i5.p1  ORF type:complete len:182 (-),score=34.94 TRINITY_DN6051_c0_g1_i5:1623-2168(-)